MTQGGGGGVGGMCPPIFLELYRVSKEKCFQPPPPQYQIIGSPPPPTSKLLCDPSKFIYLKHLTYTLGFFLSPILSCAKCWCKNKHYLVALVNSDSRELLQNMQRTWHCTWWAFTLSDQICSINIHFLQHLLCLLPCYLAMKPSGKQSTSQ